MLDYLGIAVMDGYPRSFRGVLALHDPDVAIPIFQDIPQLGLA